MKNTVSVILGLLILSSCMLRTKPEEDFPMLSGDYLGQELPGDTARLFAPGIVSTGMSSRDIAISPDGDEIYFGVSIGAFTYTTILECRRIDGRWTAPQIASFCTDPEILYLEPAFSWDGSKLFFLSTMADGDESSGDQDIWYVERAGPAWSPPVNLGAPVNTEHSEYFPSLTKEGHLYFTRAEKGSQLNRIYRSRLVGGSYQEPELLPKEVNCGTNRFNAFVSPAEEYLIIPAMGMAESYGGVDYFISFRNESDQWSEPIHMGPQINSAAMREWSAWVNRDGSLIFFMSDRMVGTGPTQWNYSTLVKMHNEPGNGNSGVYWISAGIIDKLRGRAQFPDRTSAH